MNSRPPEPKYAIRHGSTTHCTSSPAQWEYVEDLEVEDA